MRQLYLNSKIPFGGQFSNCLKKTKSADASNTKMKTNAPKIGNDGLPDKQNKFPVRLLMSALMLTGALFVGFILQIYNAGVGQADLQERIVESERLQGFIFQLDEVLTMSAKMAAATGDLRWESRYLEYESQLDSAIGELKRLAPDSQIEQFAGQTDAANRLLVQAEKRAFDLVREGEAEKARTLLAGEDYELQKKIYASGTKDFIARLKEQQAAQMFAERRWSAFSVAIIFALLVVSLLAWLALLRRLQKSRRELIASIKDREKKEEKLRQSEERYERSAANAPGMVYQFVLRPDGAVEFPFVSDGCRELYELEPDEIVSNPNLPIEMIHAEDRPGFEESVAESAKTLNPWQWEGRFILASGEEKWVQGASRPERLEDGSTVWDGLLMDITPRKRIEEAKRKSEQFESLFRLANDAILIVETESEIVLDANDKACELYDLSREEFVGRSVKDFSENPERGGKFLNKLLNEGDYQIFESVQYRADGTPMNLQISASTVEYNGRTVILSINRDITAAKKLEEDLRESEEHFRSVTDSAQDAIISADGRGNIISWNNGAKNIFGYTKAEAVGKSLSLLMPEKYREAHRKRMRRFAETGEAHVIGNVVELQGLGKDGNEFPIELSLSTWESAKGKFFTGIIRNIAERKQAEELQAKRVREAALRADVSFVLANDSSSSLQAGLTKCAEAVVEHIDAAFAQIWTLNKEENVLELQASAGLYTHTDGEHSRIPVGKFKIGLIAEEREPHLTNDVLNDPRVGNKEWAREQKMVAFAGYPLIVDGRLIGVMAIFARHELDDNTLDELAGISNLIAQSIERQRTEMALRESGQWLRTLLNGSRDGLLIEDDGVIVYVNKSYANFLQYDASEELIGKHISDILPPEEAKRLSEFGKRRLRDERVPSVYEFKGKRKDGTLVEVEGAVSTSVIGGKKYIMTAIRDIAERKQAKEELQKNVSLLTSTFEATADGILVVDTNDKIVTYNQKFLEMWNIPEEIIGLMDNRAAVNFVLGQLSNAESFLNVTDKLTLNPETKNTDLLILKDGKVYERYSHPQILDGKTVGRVLSFRDITERKRAEKQLLHDAFHDALTGLANRALFMDHLRMAIERGKSRHSNLYSVLFLDFDRFKVVNDSLGHAEGDKLLRYIARRLESATRTGDLVARLGGDEFVILLSEMVEEDDAVKVAERIRNSLEEAFDLSGREIFITASIGIALSTAGHENAEDMLRDADIAMYHAKDNGRARYQIFDRTMHEHAARRLSLETEMRRALEQNEFLLNYQPIVSLGNGKLVGFEALVRWQHPERGMIPPFEFIGAAEENGLILPLGVWTLEEGCRQLREWQKDNLSASDLTMSVNLSCKQFLQSDLVEQVAATLKKTGLDPRFLKLEITESHVMENSEVAVKMMNRLRALGIHLSLDDFGTGYSSLSYLHRLPVSNLKIDRSFISRMTESTQNSEIVRTIIKLAQNLKMKTVAEGIETEEQLEHLRRLGCEFGQGYFFSKPLQAEAASLFISDAIKNSLPLIDSSMVDKTIG